MKNHNIAFVVVFLGLLILAAIFLLPPKKNLTIQQKLLEEKQQEAKDLNRQLDDIRKENKELEQNDPHRLQQAARDTYKYCYPNEKIYNFPDKKSKE